MREERWLKWGAGLVLFLVLVFQLFPIIWMVNTSLMTQLEAATGSLFPHEPQWNNYREIWRALPFFNYLKNSFLVCFSTTVVALAVATLAGYALARFSFPGAELFGGSVLLTQVIPGILFLIPIYIMYIAVQNWVRQNLGLEVRLVGSYGGLIFTYTAFFVPISIWIMRGFFASIPKELEEAAMVDGATPFQAFYRVILPLALPGLAATAVYIFLTAWDELLFAQCSPPRTSPPSGGHPQLRGQLPEPLRSGHGRSYGGPPFPCFPLLFRPSASSSRASPPARSRG
jgi:ABC-type sugar transport system, permease component